ncbi:hypothetical protein MMC07_007954 [Pseudocyphellaria aurata]|nr:hypothetical protein [Pseudocyphellaria aurata]
MLPRAIVIQEISMGQDMLTAAALTNPGVRNMDSISQLNAGVRLLSAQVHEKDGEWHLCHSSCDLLDAGKLGDWLAKIKSWMDSNSHEVVTILLVNSDNASAEDLHAEFAAAKITSYAYTPPSTTTAITTWPTLGEMIANSTRLVTFVASLDPSTNTVAPYLLDEFTFVFENPFEVYSLSGFSCVPDRPSAVKGSASTAVQSGRLPLMNHFLDTKQAFGVEVPDIGNITITNNQTGPVGNLGDAATECKTLYGRAPTFVLVDFFDQGPAISTVDSLNGITAVGRTTAVTTSLEHTSGTAGKSDILKELSLSWPGCMGWLLVMGAYFMLL